MDAAALCNVNTGTVLLKPTGKITGCTQCQFKRSTVLTKNVLWPRTGKKKKPWSKFFKIQKLFYHCPRNHLYSIIDPPKLKAEHRESQHQNDIPQKEFDYYLYLSAVKELTERITNLELHIMKLFKENEKILGDIQILKKDLEILKGDLFDCYSHH